MEHTSCFHHNSHKSDAFHEAAFQHNIIVIAFPSKCTHKLQPLNVIIFAHTQHHWSSHCDNCIIHHVKMDRYNIIQEYMEIRPWSMTPKVLHSVFSTTGIFLFNDTLFTNNDFAPAKSFSHTMHVPESFPTEVPTSPLATSDVSDLEMSSNESDSAESVDTDAPAAQAHLSWETDSEDFDYKHPSHLTSPAAATMPTEALPIPSQLIMPAVPIIGTITSSSPLMHATYTTLASCPSHITPPTPPIPASPTMSHYMGASKSPRPWDAASIDASSQATHYYTRSQASQMASLSLGSVESVRTYEYMVMVDFSELMLIQCGAHGVSQTLNVCSHAQAQTK